MMTNGEFTVVPMGTINLVDVDITTIKIFEENDIICREITEIPIDTWPRYTQEEYIKICIDMQIIVNNLKYIHLQLIKNVNLRRRNLERQMAVIIWTDMTDVNCGELSNANNICSYL
jgi:hypothetical protein